MNYWSRLKIYALSCVALCAALTVQITPVAAQSELLSFNTQRNSLSTFDTTNFEETTRQYVLSDSRSLTVSPDGTELYFLDTRASVVFKVVPATGELTPIVIADSATSFNIMAIDFTNGFIYLGGREQEIKTLGEEGFGSDILFRYAIDGSAQQELFPLPNRIDAMAVDAAASTVYFCNSGLGLNASSGNGTAEPQNVFESGTASCNTLAVSSADSRAFFYDSVEGGIYSVNTDGSGLTLLVDELTAPLLAHDEASSRIYWTDTNGRVNYIADDGSGEVVEVALLFDTASGLAVGSSRVYLGFASNFGDKLSEGVEEIPPFFISSSSLEGGDQQLEYSADVASLRSLTVDESTGTIYFYDRDADQIVSADIDDITQVEFLRSTFSEVTRLTFNPADQKLYWLEGGNRINRMNVDGTSFEIILETDETLALSSTEGFGGFDREYTDFVIDSSNGKIFVRVLFDFLAEGVGFASGEIARIDLDGSNRVNVLDTFSEAELTNLTIDETAQELYFLMSDGLVGAEGFGGEASLFKLLLEGDPEGGEEGLGGEPILVIDGSSEETPLFFISEMTIDFQNQRVFAVSDFFQVGLIGVDLDGTDYQISDPLDGRYDSLQLLTDTDSDGDSDIFDNCVNDSGKTEPGVCGCGIADTDTDGDGTADCNDTCSADPAKVEPGVCGCGVVDGIDANGNGVDDCRAEEDDAVEQIDDIVENITEDLQNISTNDLNSVTRRTVRSVRQLLRQVEENPDAFVVSDPDFNLQARLQRLLRNLRRARRTNNARAARRARRLATRIQNRLRE